MLLMVAGLHAEQVQVVEELVTPGAQELVDAGWWSMPTEPVTTQAVEVVGQPLVAMVEPMPLPADSAQIKEMAVQAVDNLNRFFVLPPVMSDVLVALAQNSDLIVESIKISWDKALPMLKDLALDLGPQIRETFHLLQPLAEGNFDGVARVGDALIIKAGDVSEVIFNYHPRLIKLLSVLKDSPEAMKLKVLVESFATQHDAGRTINVQNINYALEQILSALQNREVLNAIRDGINELKTPGFWNRMEAKFAPELNALRRLAQQALDEARNIIIDRTGKTPEQWAEEIKARGADAVKALEAQTGKSADELLAIVKAQSDEFRGLVQQNVDRVQGQIAALMA